MALWVSSSLLLYRTHLVRQLRSRRVLFCVFLAAFPPLVAGALRVFEGNYPPVPAIATLVLGWAFLLQTILPLIALILGSAAVAEEIEDRTITYLVTRPIPRPAILLGRWAAGCTVVLALSSASAAVAFSTLLELGVASSQDPALPAGIFARFLATTLLAGIGYSALFAVLGTFVRHPVLVGLGYTFVFEVFLANLPGANQALTLQFYLKSYLLAPFPSLAERYGELFQLHDLLPAAEALENLVLVPIIALALGAWRLSRREILISS